MCLRRGYGKIEWDTLTIARTQDYTTWIYIIESIDKIGTISPDGKKILVLFDFIRMRKFFKSFLGEAELFCHLDFVYDPMSQSPPMRLLNEEEKETKKINKENWEVESKILESDIIARYFGAKKGDVFEVIKNDRNPKTITYRVVV